MSALWGFTSPTSGRRRVIALSQIKTLVESETGCTLSLTTGEVIDLPHKIDAVAESLGDVRWLLPLDAARRAA